MRFELHIPAWHHTELGDQPAKVVGMCMEAMPRENEQIELGSGLVEVCKIRHRPGWTDEGARDSFSDDIPQVITNWVTRPEGAPKFRSR